MQPTPFNAMTRSPTGSAPTSNGSTNNNGRRPGTAGSNSTSSSSSTGSARSTRPIEPFRSPYGMHVTNNSHSSSHQQQTPHILTGGSGSFASAASLRKQRDTYHRNATSPLNIAQSAAAVGASRTQQLPQRPPPQLNQQQQHQYHQPPPRSRDDLGVGHSISPHSAISPTAQGARSPTQFSYWEKRDIWVKRELEAEHEGEARARAAKRRRGPPRVPPLPSSGRLPLYHHKASSTGTSMRNGRSGNGGPVNSTSPGVSSASNKRDGAAILDMQRVQHTPPRIPHALHLSNGSTSSLPSSTSIPPPVISPVSASANSFTHSLATGGTDRANTLLQTELDYEWSRRRIPRVKLKTMAKRVEAKLREEAEELEEKKRNLVRKLLAMKIWSTESGSQGKPDSKEVLDGLSHYRFDLLRFTFELTELEEMEGRNIKFLSFQQAMSALRILYDKMTPAQIASFCLTNQIPSHVQAYLEARKNEISNSREERVTYTAQAYKSPTNGAGVGLGNGNVSPRDRVQSMINLSSSAPASMHSSPAASSLQQIQQIRTISPPAPIIVTSLAHRSIRLLDFVEVLREGNLLSGPAIAPTSPAALAWLLADAGLDLAEVSIDDLIQMQQHPSLARSFTSPKQLVEALSIMYTDTEEHEITEICDREGLDSRVRAYLIEEQRTKPNALIGDEHVTHHHSGGKRSKRQRVRRRKEMRAKVVQYELQDVTEESESDQEPESARLLTEGKDGNGTTSSTGPSSSVNSTPTLTSANHRKKPRRHASGSHVTALRELYQSYAASYADRILNPLPAITPSALSAALASSSLLSGKTVSTEEVAKLVVEMDFHISEDVDIDLQNLHDFESAGLKFQNTKQLLQAMQLMQTECDIDEFQIECSRASLDGATLDYLTEHARCSVSNKVLSSGAARQSAAAKYALLEFDVQNEWEEEAAYTNDDDYSAYGDGNSMSSHTPSASRSLPLRSYEIHDLIHEPDDVHLMMLEDCVLTLDEIVARIQRCNPAFLQVPSVNLTTPNLLVILNRLDLPLSLLDRDMWYSDIDILERTSGLTFDSIEILLNSLTSLQLSSTQNEFEIRLNTLYQNVMNKKVKEKIKDYFIHMYRAGRTRIRKGLAPNLNGGGGGNSSAARPQAQSVMLTSTYDDGSFLLEEVVETSRTFIKQIQMYDLLEMSDVDEGDQQAQYEHRLELPVISSLLMTSSIETLPEFHIDSDLRMLHQQGMKFQNAKQIVEVLEFLHSDENGEHMEVPIIGSSPGAATPTSASATRAKHTEFLMQYRRQHVEEWNATLNSTRLRRQAKQAQHQRMIYEIDFSMDDMNAMDVVLEDNTEENVAAIQKRRAAAILGATRHTMITDAAPDDDVGVEQLLNISHELHYEFNEYDSLDIEKLIRYTQKHNAALGSGGQAIEMKHIVMTLQLMNEESNIAAAQVSPNGRHSGINTSIQSKMKDLPVCFVKYLTQRHDRSQRLSDAITERRVSKKKKKNQSVRSSPSGSPKMIAMTLQHLDEEFASLEWNDLGEASTSSSASSSSSKSLRSYCTEMQLDLSEVTLEEVRVIRTACAKKQVQPKQVVTILKLLQVPMNDPTLSAKEDALEAELDRLEPTSKTSSQAKHALIRTVLAIEEELAEELWSLETSIPSTPQLDPMRRASRLPPPLPSGSSMSAISPPPPPFPPHLMKSSSDASSNGGASSSGDDHVLSPPIPAYPHGLVPPVSVSNLHNPPLLTLPDSPAATNSTPNAAPVKHNPSMSYPSPPSVGGRPSSAQSNNSKSSADSVSSPKSKSSLAETNASLIAQHIRNSSHFIKHKPPEENMKEMPPIQENETPPPIGCCGAKTSCVIL